MKIVVFGANGGVGRHLVQQGLESGHSVTAVVRSLDSFSESHERLKTLKGDILDPHSLSEIVAGQDGVLAAVAPKMKIFQQTTLFSEGISNIARAMDNAGVKRVVWVTSGGVDPADSKAAGFFFDQVFKPLFLKGIYADCVISEKRLAESRLEWIVVRPTRLTDGPLTKQYRVESPHTPRGGKTISRADVAHFMLSQISDDSFLRTTPVLAY